MKKRLTNNLLLKVVSIIIAVLLWAVIANINDPIVSIPYNVPVTFINGSYVESNGKTFRVAEEDQDQRVRVVLRGNRSVVENRSLEEIEAVADLSRIENLNAVPHATVPVNVTCDRVLPEDITVTPQSVRVVLEDKASQEFIVSYNVISKPDNRYAVGEVTATPEKVKITGPASLIRKIDRVVADVNVAGIDKDTKGTSSLKVFDRNQDILTSAAMSYLRFDTGEPEVVVDVKLWRIVPEIKINVHYSGEAGLGYHVSDISSTPGTISIAGTAEALEELRSNNNTIEIPASEVNIGGATADVDRRIDLIQFLPPGTKISSDVTTAIVTVSVLPVGSKTFELLTRNIEIIGLDASYTVVYDTEEITLNISGPEEVLRTLNDNTVRAQIDLSEQEIGKQKVPIKISVPNQSELLEEVSVGIEIIELDIDNEFGIRDGT